MGRLPKIRVSYFNDAQFMLRLIQAVERDSNRPSEWKGRVITLLQELSSLFLNAPSKKAA
jgi:hypothetical protein